MPERRRAMTARSEATAATPVTGINRPGHVLVSDVTIIESTVWWNSVISFHVTPTGKFVDVRSIGRFCYEDDQLFFSQGSKRSSGQVIRPYAEQTINSLKHRLMVFLFHRAQAEGTSYALRKFYQYFDQFKVLRMWKMQLLDENHLLIKYASEDVVTLKCQDPNSQPSFFVVYNMMTTEVLAVFENTSENFWSSLRISVICSGMRPCTVNLSSLALPPATFMPDKFSRGSNTQSSMLNLGATQRQ